QANAEALAISSQLGDPAWQCEILITGSQIFRRQGLFEVSLKRCQQALALLSNLSEAQRLYVQADINIELGKIARDQRDWQHAQAYFQAARDVFRLDIENP